MTRARRFALVVCAASLELVGAGCTSAVPDATAPEVPAAAFPCWQESVELRARASRQGGEEQKATRVAAIAAAQRALAAAPDEFRLATVVQDLEFELDERAARDRYAALSQATASEKTLAARALLPERPEEARKLLEAACEQDDHFAWARYGLAFVERALAKPDRAVKDAERALRLESSLIEALRLLADLYEDVGDREKELVAREKLIDVTKGDNLEEKHRYAQLLLVSDAKRDATAAEKKLQEILDELGDPPPPDRRELARDCRLDVGTAMARRRRWGEAIEWWNRALALDDECLVALYDVGLVELEQRHPQQALDAFRRYLEVAQTTQRPLGTEEVYFRLFFVPHQVLELEKQLGKPAEEGTPAASSDAQPPTEGR